MNADLQLLRAAIKGTDLDPTARLDLLRRSGTVLFETVGGSHMYGTNLPTSDKDMRGVFCMPRSEYIGLRKTFPKEMVSDNRKIEGQKAKNDDAFYTLRRMFDLLQGANPNVIELLWAPDDCVITITPEWREIVANRSLFITKACLGSHFGYAQDQIGKARGKNKKVNNPWPKERPKKLDFCRIIWCIPGDKRWTHPDVQASGPFRPVPLNKTPWVDLRHFHVSAVEHMKDAYRLYYYGEEARGVFRGDDMLVCESVPIDDEWVRFSGILLYDEHEYEAALRAWGSYWDWVENRNIHRWVDQEKGLVDYDAKNMMHCMRLLWSGLNILKHGEPLVRFHGEARDRLLSIRRGEPKYDDLMSEVERRVAEMEEVAKTSPIPHSVDEAAVDALYQRVSGMAWERLFGGA